MEGEEREREKGGNVDEREREREKKKGRGDKKYVFDILIFFCLQPPFPAPSYLLFPLPNHSPFCHLLHFLARSPVIFFLFFTVSSEGGREGGREEGREGGGKRRGGQRQAPRCCFLDPPLPPSLVLPVRSQKNARTPETNSIVPLF